MQAEHCGTFENFKISFHTFKCLQIPTATGQATCFPAWSLLLMSHAWVERLIDCFLHLQMPAMYFSRQKFCCPNVFAAVPQINCTCPHFQLRELCSGCGNLQHTNCHQQADVSSASTSVHWLHSELPPFVSIIMCMHNILLQCMITGHLCIQSICYQPPSQSGSSCARPSHKNSTPNAHH